jgi:hypothetical protein
VASPVVGAVVSPVVVVSPAVVLPVVPLGGTGAAVDAGLDGAGPVFWLVPVSE